MKQTWYLALGLIVATLCAPLVAGQAPSAQVMLEAARKAETIDGDPKAAIAKYEQVLKRFASDRAVVADALVRMAGAYRKLGDKQATAIYERVIREFSDQGSAALAARAALGTSKPRAMTGAEVASVRRVWSGEGVDVTGAVTRDGRLLSFTDWDTGDLAVRELATGETRRITNKGPWAKSPSYAERSVFSPDARHVAYGWAVDDQSGYEVRVVDLQNPAAPPRRLTDKPLPWIAPYDWSADGRWLAVIANPDGKGTALHVMDAQSGAMRQVMRDQGLNGIRFTPDSRAVVVDRRNGTSALASDIVAVTLADLKEHVLVSGGGRNVPLGWAPDGGLLFASTRSGSQGLWLQPLRGLTAHGSITLIKGDVGMTSLGMTTTGALFIGSAAMNFQMQVVEVARSTARTVPGSASTFESYVGVNLQPTWSPDGTSLAFINRRDRTGRSAGLVIRTMASGVERELSPTLQRFNMPRWLADGRALVVQGVDLEDRQGLFRLDAESGATTPVVLAAANGNLGLPQPTPDGERLIYRRWADDVSTIVERTLTTGAERVVQPMSQVGNFSLAPDGRSIAIVERDRIANTHVVRVLSLATGESREVYRDDSLLAFTLSWAGDSTHLVSLRTIETSRKREAILIPAGGGPVTRLDLPSTVAGPVAVHPDGRHFAYQMGERMEEVWVLENFLPQSAAARR